MPWIIAGCFFVTTLVALGYVLFLRRENHKGQIELEWLRQTHEQYKRNPSILAHEIRSPLTVLIGNSELLQDKTFGELSERQQEMVSRIETNARLLQDMAEDFLTAARIDAELFELKLQTFDIVSLIRQITGDLLSVKKARIKVTRRVRSIWVQADKRLIRQALTNLINNAISHAGDDASIEVNPYHGKEGCVIDITDNGAGMTEVERIRIFQPYVRGSSGQPGTGLGMMITKKIINLHQGRIQVDSIAERGTRIRVILPALEVKEETDDEL
ncbi:ATPase/histidine kinase/DNA gyrase B/HSP90 domain protein [Mobiluncus mulieris 28-1]|uniref:sensor histidine kinase n=1 Tax=Mobiluncus mulieris TaxID=2052 RepID=UPI0001BE7A20|nr:HAMP domain-containing sensor histidine kinase [Mobiluncus mulieris]EEZ90747.1 ATPase/histidine kinase/DNA gyrase B/HSP90 domain protein [Mobiluncus mulieris 28-1]